MLSGMLAASLLWAASRIEDSVPFPPFSVAERVIRLTPGDVATFFIDNFQHNALRLLAAGVALAFLVVATFLPEILRVR
jgi:hypothetical protein